MSAFLQVNPQHLMTGIVMSAPAAIGISKLNWPETEVSCLDREEDMMIRRGYGTVSTVCKHYWAVVIGHNV